MIAPEFRAETLPEGRARVTVTAPNWHGEMVPHVYETTRNINGNAYLMHADGTWRFIPHEWARPAWDAIAAARGAA